MKASSKPGQLTGQTGRAGKRRPLPAHSLAQSLPRAHTLTYTVPHTPKLHPPHTHAHTLYACTTRCTRVRLPRHTASHAHVTAASHAAIRTARRTVSSTGALAYM